MEQGVRMEKKRTEIVNEAPDQATYASKGRMHENCFIPL